MSQPVDRRRQAHDHGHLRARHRPRHRAGAGRRTASRSPSRGCRRRSSGSACTVKKNSPDMLMVDPPQLARRLARPALHLELRDLQVKDVLARLDGVGDVQVFGARDYAMRIWLDPDKVAARNLTASEVRRRAARAERPGRRRRPQPAAGARARAPTSSTSRRSAGSSTRAVRQHRRQDRRRAGG